MPLFMVTFLNLKKCIHKNSICGKKAYSVIMIVLVPMRMFQRHYSSYPEIFFEN